MSDAEAVLALAKVREAFVRDDDGREKAGQLLITELLGACQRAGLHVGVHDHATFVAVHHPPPVRLFLGTAAGDILIGKGDKQTVFDEGIEYDPVQKAFVAADPDGPDALTLLARHVAGLLLQQTKAEKTRRAAKEF
jgi:hypothetical protein